MTFAILFDMFLNLSFKVMTSIANMARTTTSTNKIYILGKISKHRKLDRYMKRTFLTSKMLQFSL